MPLKNAFADLATEGTLAALLAELLQKLEPGQQVALAQATIEALKSNATVTVMNPGASEPTLNLVRDQLVALSDKVATETTVAGLLTDARLRAAPVDVDTGLAPLTNAQLRATPPAFLMAAGDRFGGYVGAVEDKAVETGRFRWAGGKAETSALRPNASMSLVNPANSLRDLVLTRFMVEVDASADVVYWHEAVSTGESRTAFNPNHRFEAELTYGELRVGSDVLSGGQQLSMVRRANPQSPIAVGPFEWRIQPGHTWSVQFNGPGAANNVWFNAGWYEIGLGEQLT